LELDSDLNLGFLGVKSYLKNANLPHKSSKKQKLTKQEKKENRKLRSS